MDAIAVFRQSLGHILQVCPRTHTSRVARYDKIIDLVEAGACRLGWGICQEPAIPKPAGIRRLDLILDCQDTVIVLDVTIVADNVVLYQAHQHKCDFYNQPGIRDWVSTPTYLFIGHFELGVFGMTRRHGEDLDKTVQDEMVEVCLVVFIIFGIVLHEVAS